MLNTIKNALEKRGPEFVDNFLSRDLIITEKLDTYRIQFEKVGDKILYFKKDNSEINLIERVLTNIWEDAIIELSIILNEEVAYHLPEGVRFGLAYTPVEKPVRIVYDQIPKYILTDITKRDPDTKKVVEIFSYDEIIGWAKQLKLGSPPIIFKGTLSKEKRQLIKEYSSDNFDNVSYLKDIFGKTYSNSPIIEGIVIQSDDGNLLQVESYEFRILNESYERQESSRDFYDLTILDINSFMEKYKFQSSISESDTPDRKYLSIICDIFNKYCDERPIHEELDPNYISPPSFGYSGELNLLLLEDKKTLSILESGNKVHQSVFKIMLSSFRKYKKPIGLLKESDTEKFNTYVYLIGEKSGFPQLNKLPSVVTLNEEESSKSKNTENVVVKELDKRTNYSDIDNMRVIASVQKAFRPKAFKTEKGAEECIIYLIDPSPITVSHQENLKNLYEVWKKPVVIVYVEFLNRRKGERFHFSNKLKKAQIQFFSESNSDIVKDFFYIESWDLSDIFNKARNKWEPIAILTDNDLKSEFVLQLYFEEKIMGKRIDVKSDFNIGEMKNKDSLRAMRSIEDADFHRFKGIVPDSMWGLFDTMVSEYRSWSGVVPAQFHENSFE